MVRRRDGDQRLGNWAVAAVGAALALMLAQGAASAAQPIGNTQVVVRTVTGEIEQQVRRLSARDLVHQDEIISTGADSATEIVFDDGTKVSLGPNTLLTLDRFVYDPNKKDGGFEVTVFEGVARFVSGQLSDPNKANFQIKTPTVTIAIRGTILTAVVGAGGVTSPDERAENFTACHHVLF